MPILTTVVGSYPVPHWLLGNASRGALRDAIMVVLKTQELAGKGRDLFEGSRP